jgi:hypothetical protein
MEGLSCHASSIFLARVIAAVELCGFLVGCSGHVYTFVKPTPTSAASMYKFEGVLVYPPTNFMEISWTTAVLEQNTNKVLRTDTGTTVATKCIPRLQVKQVVRGDYDGPYQLLYDPGFLEKYSFKAEFEQGVLKSVNADSTPDRGETFKNLATAAGEAAKIASGTFAPDQADQVPCTHEPMLTSSRSLRRCVKTENATGDHTCLPNRE